MTTPQTPAPDFLHDAIMEAVVFAAERFLGGGDWQNNLEVVLARLGEAAGVSRAYIFKHGSNESGSVVTRRAEWVGAGVQPQIDNPALQDLSLRDAGLAMWEEGLARGEIMQAHVGAVPEQAQRLMTPQAIRSLIHVPIHVDDEWWGFIGFDECRAERVWTASEQSALRAAGQLLGAAIGRYRLERDIEDQRLQAQLQAEVGALVTEGALGEGTFAERCVRLLVERLELDAACLWRHGAGGRSGLLAGHPADGVACRDGHDPEPADDRLILPLIVGDKELGRIVVGKADGFERRTFEALWSVCDEIALALTQESSIERLRAQEERFRALVATAPDGILVLDEDGTIVSTNAALDELAFAAPGELEGRDFASLIPNEEARTFAEHLSAFAGAVDAPPDLSGEGWMLRTLDGREIPVEVLFGGYRDGPRRFLTAFVRDVSERRRAEENARHLIREQAARSEAEAAHRRSEFLSEASRTLATSFDYATTLGSVVQLAVPELADYAWVDVREGTTLRRVGVAHVDPHEEPTVLHALRQLDGAEGTHMLATLFEDGVPLILPEVDLEAALAVAPDEEYAEALRSLGPRSLLAVPVVVRDRTIAAIVLAFSTSGRSYSREDSALARDLASRASLAVENAQLYWEALDAKRARDDILGVVAHDLRNPLNTIGMAGQTLLDVDHPAARKMGGTIERSVTLMNRLIGDLLQTRQLDAGSLRLELQRHVAWEIAEEALATLRPLATARGQELVAIPYTEPCEVHVDQLRILQVISNLVGNAVKFTPEGGRIELSCQGDGDAVRFTVRDDGPGIPSEQLPHVFGRFWKAHAGDGQGLGLGLSIAEGIVTEHGGRIWVESEAGAGAAFHFTLPLAPPEGTVPETAEVARLGTP
ncbi:MAG TPA: ATP-binding protein [Longimicrobiales bacterium]|nr:ATP-binding protein [Longimicrobiales bacterium]